MISQKRICIRSALKTTITNFAPLRKTCLTQSWFSQWRETRAAPDYTKILLSSRGLKSGEWGMGNGEWGEGRGDKEAHLTPTPHSLFPLFASLLTLRPEILRKPRDKYSAKALQRP